MKIFLIINFIGCALYWIGALSILYSAGKRGAKANYKIATDCFRALLFSIIPLANYFCAIIYFITEYSILENEIDFSDKNLE